MNEHKEYLRRNLMAAQAAGIQANAHKALERLLMMKRPPIWLADALRGIQARSVALPAELAAWRDVAPDAPLYARPETSQGEQSHD